MFQARFGLSGFADAALRRALYPDAPRHELLARYADVFGLYEVADAADPGFTRAHAERLVDHAPAGLLLLPRLPTAPTPHQVEDWTHRLAPLLRSPRCGPLHLPWSGPWSAHQEQVLQQAVDRLHRHLPASGRVAVEFLHGSWLRPSALRLLEEHEVSLAWSTRAGTLPYKVTADFLYVRLTGIHHRRCRDGSRKLKNQRIEYRRRWLLSAYLLLSAASCLAPIFFLVFEHLYEMP